MSEVRQVESKKVMYVETTDIPDGISSAFHALELKLPTLRQRKFYGVMFGCKYWAAVELIPQDNPESMGLIVGVLPGGSYACKKIKNWNQETLATDIPRTFKEMTSGRHVDESRPFIEFYRNQEELVLQAPVLEK